ncbi:hypothetical protein FMN50_08495 [Rhodobacterales bacterium]|nr:hypothetical protein FMN50_08495 [Rhodobacterales bacterium]
MTPLHGRVDIALAGAAPTIRRPLKDDHPGIGSTAPLAPELERKLTDAFAMHLGAELATDGRSSGSTHRLSGPL